MRAKGIKALSNLIQADPRLLAKQQVMACFKCGLSVSYDSSCPQSSCVLASSKACPLQARLKFFCCIGRLSFSTAGVHKFAWSSYQCRQQNGRHLF